MASAELDMQALAALAHAVRRDAEKGGAGARTTVEIAERLQVKTATARRVLWRLANADYVDVFDGQPMSWRLTPAGSAFLTARQSP